MKRFIALFMIIVLASMMLVGCGGGQAADVEGGQEAASDEPIVLRFSHGYPPTAMHQTYIEWFRDKVQERTDGRVKIEIYPNSQLMPSDQEIPGMQNGTIDGAYQISSVLGSIVPEAYVFDLPMLFTVTKGDLSHLQSFVESEDGGKIIEGLAEEKGVKVLSWATTEYPMLLFNNIKPIKTIADAEGLKIRSPGGVFTTRAAEVMGISPMTISGAEHPTALMQGVVDGSITPPAFAYDTKLPLKYCTWIPMNYTPTCPLLMSLNKFNSLPKDIQDVLVEVGNELTEHAHRSSEANTVEKYELLMTERGIEIDYLSDDEMVKLEEKFKGVWEEFRASTPKADGMLKEVENLRPAVEDLRQ